MLIEGKEMTTPISTTSTLNLNLSAVNAPLTEVNRAEADTNKPLSPETQQALERWYAKQWDFYGLYPQANQNKLSDFLAHPVKNLGVVIGIGVTTIQGLGLILGLRLFALTKAKDIVNNASVATKRGIKIVKVGTLLQAGKVLFWGGLTFADYLLQKNRNKDTLKGIQTLGDQATRQEWIDYKKAHPAIANA